MGGLRRGRSRALAASRAARALAVLVTLMLPLGATARVEAANLFVPTVLDQFLNGLNSLSTEFTQTAVDAHGIQAEAGSGSLQLQRPAKFRWDYRPRPEEADATSGNAPAPAAAEDTGQLMVADGKSLWYYDRELAQVTVKPVGAALSSTPIMLLSGSIAQLHENFLVNKGGAREGLQWVEVKPRTPSADFKTAELGFDGQRLVRMLVHDNLGQTVRLDFSRSQRNVSLPATLFHFKPPAGVDVIGTTH